jgi:hypothetical protein
VAVLVLGRVEDNGGEEGADGDGELVKPDDQATDVLGRTFTLVHGNQARNEANPKTGDDWKR